MVVAKSFESRKLVVAAVQPDSPWQVAGLQRGDTIEAVSGTAIGSWLDLRAALQSAAADSKSTVEVRLNRAGEQLNIQVKPRGTGLQVREEFAEPEFR